MNQSAAKTVVPGAGVPRVLVAHIHLFKNAGTSVERSLAQFFGDRWVSWDKPTAGARITQIEVESYLGKNPDVAALSSHQLRPPLVDSESLKYLPIVFLRHPIDRIRSAYEFERTQGSASPSSKAASESDMAGWIEFHRQKRSSQCQDFQTIALTHLRSEAGAPLLRMPISQHLTSAVDYLESLPVVGLVERYEESWELLSDWLRRFHPTFESQVVRANATTSENETIDDRIGRVATNLGKDAFERLMRENEADLQLFRWAQGRLDDDLQRLNA